MPGVLYEMLSTASRGCLHVPVFVGEVIVVVVVVRASSVRVPWRGSRPISVELHLPHGKGARGKFWLRLPMSLGGLESKLSGCRDSCPFPEWERTTEKKRSARGITGCCAADTTRSDETGVATMAVYLSNGLPGRRSLCSAVALRSTRKSNTPSQSPQPRCHHLAEPPFPYPGQVAKSHLLLAHPPLLRCWALFKDRKSVPSGYGTDAPCHHNY